jgi:methylenetetrahydrofolate--tRNA-(uracil-5-)-methyltransferase
MNAPKGELIVIGGGLAGSEAAWQAAERGLEVTLFEMRPATQTPAHQTDRLAELVCSNSLGSTLADRAPGLLKEELRRLGSLILRCADETALPAGMSLAVDRERFAALVTERVLSHPRITLRREEATALSSDALTVVATGPLTSPALSAQIAALAGAEHLYFYDAMAPIVTLESVDQNRVFRASRWGRSAPATPDTSPPSEAEDGDYINCPMSREEYQLFWQALLAAERTPLHDFEREDARFFEACLPVEVLAARGEKALAYGPLKPVGLVDPRSGRRPYAVVQLRQDNSAGTLYNLVGFQTNLRWGEQERVFRLIPGLERAEFVRFGQMHRNTFVNAPALLAPTMQCRKQPNLFFGGQITGTEGYIGSTASGWLAGVNAARWARGLPLIEFPPTTMIGALAHYVTTADEKHFQPIKPNFGLLPLLEKSPADKRKRNQLLVERAREALDGLLLEATK